MRSFGLFILLVIASALPALAGDLVHVQATGRAVSTGLGQDVIRRRALQEALIEAALSAGAEVKGYAALSNDIITSDQLVVRPSSSILGYRVISEGRSGDYYSVTVYALIGEPSPANFCPQVRTTKALAYQPQVIVDYNAPHWLLPLGESLADYVLQAINADPHTQLEIIHSAAPSTGVETSAPADMDYASLTRQRKGTRRRLSGVSNNQQHTLVLSSSLHLSVEGGGVDPSALLLTLHLRLLDKTTAKIKAEKKIARRVSTGTRFPIIGINRLLRKDRDTLLEKFKNGLSEEIAPLFGSYACRDLVAPLALIDGKLTVPFGANDGLTRGFLAYTDRTDYPYLLLEIKNLSSNSATLQPIDPGVRAAALAGLPVRFMEGGL